MVKVRVEGGVLGVTEKGSDTERKRESEREGVRESEREREMWNLGALCVLVIMLACLVLDG